MGQHSRERKELRQLEQTIGTKNREARRAKNRARKGTGTMTRNKANNQEKDQEQEGEQNQGAGTGAGKGTGKKARIWARNGKDIVASRPTKAPPRKVPPMK